MSKSTMLFRASKLFDYFPSSYEAVSAIGGANRDRTDDLKLAKLALSQLSYGPVVVEIMVGSGGPGKT